MGGSINAGIEAGVRKIVSGEVRRDEPMERHASLGVGGSADLFIAPRNEDELARLVVFLRERQILFFPVGNCTNLIVRDGGYRGALISLRDIRGMELRRDPSGEIFLYAGAGVSLARMVEKAVKESLTGLEFCAGIPGTLGGALRMNAGAWGGSMEDIVRSLFLLSPMGNVEERGKERLSFSYRSLGLPENHIITSALLSLRQGDSGEIKKRVEEFMALRRQRHPVADRSAGSIFKNPSRDPAGKLIEEAGLKGTRVGEAMVSELHGNFIVNAGKATSADVLTLIERVRATVKSRTGIGLETEVIVIGEEP
ncbi:MAG: UDP-N-acetylmuramate dehydrogenase [Syntrophales bacterium]|nr:UDP-N-acetylmuramate dehydrogenase [Syntrophales bacterium]